MSSSATSSSAARRLFKELITAGKNYPDYNIRHYILRRTRDAFRANRAIVDATEALANGRAQLDLVRRQATIAGMFKSEPSIMEGRETTKQSRTG